ncbi:23S rRNA (uracil(1939)-C(5))-methyltransferase RlmD [Litoribrevibacter albus]|uniref:23S rRNA (Uracil(1939)-C(5))-methyltransferase RlmD n=1 Tax=Litoribrevibacter albus TaxID=1473156 RepID=A0AA37W850_9GAMM|nr:23S rRNA (uracil(1939)-C(5))-methyltransferase RlmD [Litoribrevibacter albus]GLQ31196.1 23S rRNA (uracil(1939)-C(5))-methyltransferase RlmD [Litoribrevibacter albus]
MAKSTSGFKNKRRGGYRKPANNIQTSGKQGGSSSGSPQFIEVDVDRLSYDGKGIARFNGRACFIPDALPGEKVKAQITAANNKRVEAKLIKVLEASTERVTPQCPVYEECGGCDLQHMSHQSQIAHKQTVVEQLLLRGTDLEQVSWHEPIVSENQGYGYRRKIRLACYYDASCQVLKVGFRAARSKKIVPVSDCAIVTNEMKALLKAVYGLVEQLHQDVTKTSVLRQFAHIECVADQDSQSVCFRLLERLPEPVESIVSQWAETNELNLWFRVGNEPLTLKRGMESVSCLKDGVKLAYSPEDFLQVNAGVNDNLVQRVMEVLNIQASDRVLDLFSGLGNFTLSSAKRAKRVKAVEAIDVMVEKSLDNARLNQLENVDAEVQDLFDEAALQWLDDSCDCLILDPPRAGAELISQHVGRTKARRIAYVSCNPQSLARDSQWILQQGYQLDSLTLLDMFPQTSHIETLAVFTK